MSPATARGIRLAYLVSRYPTITHTFILREIRALRDGGFDVQVISIRSADRPFSQLSETEQAESRNTFSVLSSGFSSILAAHLATLVTRPLAYFGSLFFALRLAGADLRKAVSHLIYFGEAVIAARYMHRMGLAHVHSHFSSTIALLMARVYPVTFSATIHGSAEFINPVGFYLREKVAAAQFICAISDYGASQIMKDSDPGHWHKVVVNRLGVDTGVFLPSGKNQNPERIELLCVGSLVPPKGYPILISALDRLIREGRATLHLRIAGEGHGRLFLEKMIAERKLEDHVTLEGSCTQEQILSLYRQADLFVLASFAEGIPVVLMEAMSMEIPCIATWITGIPELIRHGVDGWLLPPGNERELAGAIAYLIDHPELRRQLGSAGRARVREQYELGRNVEALGRIYQSRF
jgi:colanic acid/amylovoran biosynthesis glycosyltransferase